RIYAIDPSDGSQKWTPYATGGEISSAPAIAADDILYIGSGDGTLYAIDTTTRKLSWASNLGTNMAASSPTMGLKGNLYIGGMDGTLFAMETGSDRLAQSAWPKFNHDVRNVSRNNANQGPTARTGEDQEEVTGEDTVMLDGSRSSDPDYGIPVYEWNQTEGTSVTLSDSKAVRPVFSAPNAVETLTFELKVTDNSGLSDTDTCSVTITRTKEDDDKGCFINTVGSGWNLK
ncbi:MAG: PQQ-binding-like beta-propeller repeat protein, partial [Desulfatiglandaceae bacterium]